MALGWARLKCNKGHGVCVCVSVCVCGLMSFKFMTQNLRIFLQTRLDERCPLPQAARNWVFSLNSGSNAKGIGARAPCTKSSKCLCEKGG